MNRDEFKTKIPNIEGYTIGGLRINGNDVKGFVLIDKEGNKRYILRIYKDLVVEDYW